MTNWAGDGVRKKKEKTDRTYLQSRAKVLVLLRKPLEQTLWVCGLFHLHASGLVNKLFAVFLLLLVAVNDDFLCETTLQKGLQYGT